MKKYDVLVVGAGFAGSVSARALADRGKSVLILESRDHIGGNAYDFMDEMNVLQHKYGPHIFHTDSIKVYKLYFDLSLYFTPPINHYVFLLILLYHALQNGILMNIVY